MAKTSGIKRERSENFDYEKLAEVIIVNSAKDYCFAIKTLLRNPHSCIALQNKIEIEEFFHSKWFQVLSGVKLDPDELIERLINKAKVESHYESKKRPRKEIRAEKAAFFARRKAKIAREKEKARLKAEAMAKKKEETA